MAFGAALGREPVGLDHSSLKMEATMYIGIGTLILIIILILLLT